MVSPTIFIGFVAAIGTCTTATPTKRHIKSPSSLNHAHKKNVHARQSPIGLSDDRTHFEPAQGGQNVNTGGTTYCSNIIKASPSTNYDYTNNIINTSDHEQLIVVWNWDGYEAAPRTACLTFTLRPGQSQTIAMQEGSKVGWSQNTGIYTTDGGYATTIGGCWLDPDRSGSQCFVDSENNTRGNTFDMTITNSANECVSDKWQNSLSPQNDAPNGQHMCYVEGAKAAWTTRMGGQK